MTEWLLEINFFPCPQIKDILHSDSSIQTSVLTPRRDAWLEYRQPVQETYHLGRYLRKIIAIILIYIKLDT